MPRFLNSEDYDDQAHRLYNEGDYDGALEMLKEGILLFPDSVDLHVGLGYARLAREEFAWARQAFSRAVALDPSHEDALVGLGETLLRLGDHRDALRLFREVRALGYDDDVELLLTMGRALYREGLYGEAREAFSRAVSLRPDHAEATASLGYALHRLGDEVGAARQIRRALRLDGDLHEARVYLGHLLYDRGDWEGTLREFEQVPPDEHWDPLAVWRAVELKRALWHVGQGDATLAPWEERLAELEASVDPDERLLAEIEAKVNGYLGDFIDPSQLELFERGGPEEEFVLRLRRLDGRVFEGTPAQIVREMKDLAGYAHESLADYMRRAAERWHEQFGLGIPFNDPRSFLEAAMTAGLLRREEQDPRP